MHVGGELFNCEVFARLESSKGGDGCHFRAKVKAFELGSVEADGAIGHEFVGWTLYIQIGAEGSRRKRGTLWEIDADCGQERFEVFCGHRVTDKFDVDGSLFAARFIGAVEMSDGGADFYLGRSNDA